MSYYGRFQELFPHSCWPKYIAWRSICIISKLQNSYLIEVYMSLYWFLWLSLSFIVILLLAHDIFITLQFYCSNIICFNSHAFE